MTSRLPLAIAAAATLLGCSSSHAQIDRANVERVVSTLADDAMRGRGVFTPDLDRAAEFLAAEFAAIGLDHYADHDGYRQEFPVTSVQVGGQRVVLNGRELPPEQTAVFASGPFHWTGTSGVEVGVVGATADPRQALSRAFNRAGDLLLLIHPAHETLFHGALQRFASRGSRAVGEVTEGSNVVFVLTDDTDIASLDVQVETTVEEVGRLANVVGIIPGRRADELVIFSAHYDHIGITRPVNGDSIGNGANDDASGVAAVVELARYFKALGRPERTLVFVAFTAEESGGYGSQYFARQVDPDEVVAMFNIEMIGKPTAEGPDRAWITGWEESDFGEILAAAMPTGGFVFYGDPYPDQRLFYRSDNATLARLGVPAHSISTTPMDSDPDYHRVTDEVETLDLDHMTATIQALAQAAVPIVSGQATPSRVNPAAGR